MNRQTSPCVAAQSLQPDLGPVSAAALRVLQQRRHPAGPDPPHAPLRRTTGVHPTFLTVCVCVCECVSRGRTRGLVSLCERRTCDFGPLSRFFSRRVSQLRGDIDLDDRDFLDSFYFVLRCLENESEDYYTPTETKLLDLSLWRTVLFSLRASPSPGDGGSVSSDQGGAGSCWRLGVSTGSDRGAAQPPLTDVRSRSFFYGCFLLFRFKCKSETL